MQHEPASTTEGNYPSKPQNTKEYWITLPAKIKKLRDETAQMQISLWENTETVYKYKEKISMEIYEAMNPDGKRAYTNDKARESALRLRLEQMPEYMNAFNAKLNLERKIEQNDVEIEYLRKNFDVCKYLLREGEAV